MESKITAQQFDALMAELGLTNAALVNASKEQLTFKMVNKGRAGKRLSASIQEKIHNALLAAKPGLKVRRRDLFRYEADPAMIKGIENARALIAAGKIQYPEFVDLLVQAGVNAYTVEVAAHRITYFGAGGEAHSEQGLALTPAALGLFKEEAILSAIADAQKGSIDYQVFLKRIHEAGIGIYEVNTRNRKIVYRGADESYRENIPAAGEAATIPEEQSKASEKKAEISPSKAKKNRKKAKKSLTRKARLDSNKRWRKRQKEKRGR